jgi:hypothetical protein
MSPTTPSVDLVELSSSGITLTDIVQGILERQALFICSEPEERCASAA